MLRRYYFWRKLQWNHMKKDLTVFEGCARTPCILQLLWFRTPRTICRTCILHDWEEAEQLQQVSGKEEQHSHLQSSHFMHHVGTIQYRKNLQASKQAECRHAIWHILRSSSIPYPEKIKAFVMQELSKTAVKGGAIFVRDLRQDAEPRREDRSQNNAPDHGFLWPRYFSRNRCKKFLHVSILSGEFPNTVLALLVMAASTHDSLLLPERLSWLPQLQNVASHRSASPIPEKRETIISFSLAGRKCSLQLALTSRRNLRLSAYGMIDIDDRAMRQSRIQSSHLLLRLLRFSRKQELVNIFNNNIHAESMRNTRKETSDMRVMF